MQEVLVIRGDWCFDFTNVLRNFGAKFYQATVLIEHLIFYLEQR
jgi:hypothetical protein